MFDDKHFVFDKGFILRELQAQFGSFTIKFEPRSEKTGLQGFRPGPTQTRLYSHRRWLEA